MDALNVMTDYSLMTDVDIFYEKIEELEEVFYGGKEIGFWVDEVTVVGF